MGILLYEMRRLVILTSVVVSFALVVGLACADARTDARARVRMLDPAPLTLRGLGFADEERVRLTVSLGERSVLRKLRASETGSFTTRFDTMRYGRCGPPLEVEAAGSGGSRVSWKLVPLDCPDRNDS
jgi:hypothetical protein